MTGSGTKGDPYIISDVDDLQSINDDLDAYYELSGNIDASATSGWNGGAGFDPIGQDWSIDPFTGQFDGKGYTITGLFINRPTTDYVGLFAATRDNGGDGIGVVKNVTLANVDITADDIVGALIGDAYGDTSEVSDCHSSGSIVGSATGDAIGGLVGLLHSDMSDCSSSCTVSGRSSVGGLIGQNSGYNGGGSNTVTSCYATGDVTGTLNYAGGLIGECLDSSGAIFWCYATGDVTGVNYVGGLVGYSGLIGTGIKESYARGSVTGTDYVGGFVGQNDTSTDDCYSTGVVSGSTNTGGFCGNDADTITNCFWDTETSGAATSDGGTGKTTAQMTTKSTFTDSGWDFTLVWSIYHLVNDGYPYLIGIGGQRTMALSSLREHEIVLNSVKFPIEGPVREILVSRFPGKQTIGDYDFANEQILSNFIINDQQGGMLIEEMDESIHQNRYWESTADTRFRSNILLPPLATAVSAPDETTAPTIVNADMELETGWDYSDSNVVRSDTQKHGDTYSIRMGNEDATNTSGQYLIGWTPGVQYTFKCWVWSNDYGSGSNHVKLQIADGTQTVDSSVLAANSTWTQLSVQITVASTATYLRLILSAYQSTADYAYFDDATITMDSAAGAVAYSTTPVFVEYNSKLYAAYGKHLTVLNSGGTSFENMWQFPAVITDLVVASDGGLIILLGDADEYWYMTTTTNPSLGGAITETDTLLAKLGLRWDGKTWKMAVDGRWFSSTDPSSATPTWSAEDASGGLDDYALTPKTLEVYRDASGNLIPYCATTRGAYAYNDSGNKWVETEVILPEHDQTGLGMVVWHDAIHISAGLSVKKYIAAGTATLIDMGLDEDDGLPQLRSGEIVKFIKGYNEFFALIDSTYEGSGSRSQVVSWDGQGWRTWWEATANNKNMYSGIVSSVSAHRLWFSTTDGVYYIPLQRAGKNPKKVSGYTYAAAATHISPRFDAGTKVFPKLATKLTLFLDDMSANETVTVTYQIDQAQGALTSGWTALMAAQTADGAKEATFGTNGVGIVFYDIQFRMALARGGTNTLSPIIKGATLSYLKLLGRKKAWTMTINIAEAAMVATEPKALYDAMMTILATETLMPFTFRDGSDADDTHYVFMQPYSGALPTGPHWDSQFTVTLIEV